MDLFGKQQGVNAIASLPFPIRKRLAGGFLSSLTSSVADVAAYAQREVPLYRELHPSGPLRFSQLPLLTEEHLVRSSPERLLSRKDGGRARFSVRTASGAWCFLTSTEMLALGASALLHPRVNELKAALESNRAAVNLSPFGGSLLGPCSERLARYLGARVANVCGMPDDVVLEVLRESRPSLVVGSVRRLATLLETLHSSDVEGHRAVLRDLAFVVHIDPDGPAGSGLVEAIGRHWNVEVIDTFVDYFSFAFFGCQCGHIHVPQHYFVEAVDDRGENCPNQGRLVVTDRTRKAMPLVRFATQFQVRLYSSACTFHGQVLSVERIATRGKTEKELAVRIEVA